MKNTIAFIFIALFLVSFVAAQSDELAVSCKFTGEIQSFEKLENFQGPNRELKRYSLTISIETVDSPSSSDYPGLTKKQLDKICERFRGETITGIWIPLGITEHERTLKINKPLRGSVNSGTSRFNDLSIIVDKNETDDNCYIEGGGCEEECFNLTYKNGTEIEKCSVLCWEGNLVCDNEENESTNCPQRNPPRPNWCAGGEITEGRILENGCQGPPTCKLSKNHTREIRTERNKLRFGGNDTLPENCERHGSVVRCSLSDGSREMRIHAGRSGNVIVQVKGVNMSTKVELFHQNGSLYGSFLGNRTAQINYLPDDVKMRIRDRIKSRIHEDSFEAELDEHGIYGAEIKKRSRLFGFLKVKERVRFRIDSETGEILDKNAPWWGFLAVDEEAEETVEQ